MSLAVVGGTSIIKCSYGLVPTPLIVLPDRTVTAEGMLMGNVSDMMPFGNIEPFGDCISLANPQVLAATIAAGGVLTPEPCEPITVDPWVSEAMDVMVEGMAALDESATLMCTWEGVINIDEPGNFTVNVP